MSSKMKITLSVQEKELINKLLTTNEFCNFNLGIHDNYLQGSEEILSEFREKLADYLIQNEFDANYMPTQQGKILENLIDKIDV